MQRETSRHGYSVIHQKVVLEVDFAGSLWGYTEITIQPTHKDLRTIHLHSRQCAIHSVTVANQAAEFVQSDPFANLSLSDPQDCHTFPELKRKLYSAYAEGDEGELSIAIPRGVPIVAASGGGLDGDSRAATPDRSGSVAPGPSEPGSIVVHIDYSLRNPADGIQFVLPTVASPHRVPHAYTTPSSPDAARCWVPCVDNMSEKCTWEFEFVVPRYLEDRDGQDEEDPELNQGSYPTVVVCSGDFVEQVAHPYNSTKTIFLFSHNVNTSVQQIAWAAGPFHVYPVPTEHSDDVAATQTLMHAFCLPGHEPQLVSSVTFLRSAMNFYQSDLGSYPFNSHKLVFVDGLPTQRFDGSTVSLVTIDLLHGEDAIDQVYETRLILSHALACQWMGINIQPKAPSDTWLVNGLGLYVAGLFYRKMFGANDYRYRLKKDMLRVLELDNGSMPPVCQPQNAEPPDGAVLSFVNLKSPLILHILDRRLSKSGTSLGLSRVLPKIFLSAISGDLGNNALSTHAFLRMCRKVSGMDPRSFAEQWIYGSGFPAFNFQASFNRKKMAVEIRMRQECPAYKLRENDEIAKTLFKPVPFFEGQMTIRIHEADGTPYEHVLDIRQPFKLFEVPFNTKYKRVRRNTKRYMARQAAAQAAAEGEEAAANAPGELIDVGFGVEVWESEQERDNWKISEWTEEDEQRMAGATYEWIRLDVDLEWITSITFEQPDFMWVSQLQRDRDVVAQMEAVLALQRQPTAIITSVLTKTVLVPKYFYRIRCEAALALASCAIQKLDYLGLFHLFKLFLRYCYDPEDPRQDLFTHTYVPRSNDFTDLPEYFVRKALLHGLANVRFPNGKTPTIIRQFFIDQLRFNDNTSNPYSDAYYVCSLISALAAAVVPTRPPERNELATTEITGQQTEEDAQLLNEAISEVQRYQSMDRLIPSVHNIVTIATLEFYLVIQMADLVGQDPRVFLPYTREGTYMQARITAFDGLFLTKWWFHEKVIAYILSTMAQDPSRIVRRHVAMNACHSLALLFSMGELRASGKDKDTLVLEEEGNALAEKAKDAKRTEVELMIKAFRKDKDLGKNEQFRNMLMPVLLSPGVDHEVRWQLLKLADMLLRGADEVAPKMTVRLPPTPVTEFPPPLPVVKFKSRPTIKTELPMRSPLAPLPTTPKIKLLPSGATPTSTAVSLPFREVKAVPVSARPSNTPASSAPKQNLRIPAKPAKVIQKHVPKAQSGGMSLLHLRACRNLLKKIQTNKHAALFNQPVDPVRDKAPKYLDIIPNPMDFSTMGAKLEGGVYSDLAAFEADLRLVIANCKQYNGDNTYPFNEAVAMENFFNKQLEVTKKTIQKVALEQAALPPVPQVVMPPPPVPAFAQTPSSSRPMIKLKVGGGQPKAGESSNASPATPSVPILKVKKPKVAVDLPPPPYVDDGSHDLLQEVIAIENAKTEKPEKPEKTIRPSSSVKLTFGKRKRGNAETGDDEVPEVIVKKERSSTSVPPPETPKPKPKLVIGLAKPKPAEVVSASPAPNPPAITISRKGKEKEPMPAKRVVSRPATPETRPAMVHRAGTPINEKKCRDILKMLLKMPEAGIFARPVDPVMDGCPTYFDEIKHPMDLGTMQTNLSQSLYPTMESFKKDVDLIIANCHQFNPPGTYPITCADAVEAVFKKEWAHATQKKLESKEKRALLGVLNKLILDPAWWVFWDPVDPVALGIPTYFDVIPKKNARDLKTIRFKLEADKYGSPEALEADIDLMIDNAIAFNGVESEVGQIGTKLRARVQDELARITGSVTRKRKDGGGTPMPGAKKVKLS